MEAQLAKVDLPYDRFKAISPSKESLTEKEGEYYSFYLRALDRIKAYVSSEQKLSRGLGVFGCYLSHYFIHRRALEENWGNYLILEDDCQLNRGWLEKLNQYLSQGKIPIDWDIIRSCLNSTDRVKKLKRCNSQSKFAAKLINTRYSGGTYFQLCKSSSCQKIIDYLESDFVYNIDAVYSTNRLNVYHSKLCISHGDFGTDIPKL